MGKKRKHKALKVTMPFNLQDIASMLEDEIRSQAVELPNASGSRKMANVINEVSALLDALIILPPWMEAFDGLAVKFFLHIIADDVYDRIKSELPD